MQSPKGARVKGPNGRLTFLVIALFVFIIGYVFDFFQRKQAAEADFKAKKEWVKGIFGSMEILAKNIDQLDRTLWDGRSKADSTLVQQIRERKKQLNLELDSAKKEGAF